MTEQEKREKGIEELSKIGNPDCKNTCKDCVRNYGGCISNFNAVLFYDAGYRREEEVRKETAKEIWQRIYDDRYLSCFDKYYIVNTGKEFGVEVEE